MWKIFGSCKGQGRCVSEFPERYLYLRGSFNKEDVNIFLKTVRTYRACKDLVGSFNKEIVNNCKYKLVTKSCLNNNFNFMFLDNHRDTDWYLGYSGELGYYDLPFLLLVA